MDIFSYVIKHDAGFAPNPFGSFLTLATCKPSIRKRARKGDFVVGTGSASTVGNRKMVFAAQIDKVIPLEEYGTLPAYKVKRPSNRGVWWRRHGDNIYIKIDGKWKLRHNDHHFKDDMVRDISGKNVLICKRFWYFGGSAIELPDKFNEIIKKGPGHKRINDELLVNCFVDWLTTLPEGEGRHGTPEMSQHLTSHCSGASDRVGG